MKRRILFFGTHTFAETILASLLHNTAVEIIGVVTQPDKPVGRKKILTAPPVKIFAEKHTLPVFQPENLKSWDMPDCDVAVVAQYGLLIPKRLLNAPKHGFLNIHTSLLPKYRGASPIQSAILNGDTETGITLMQMDEGLDTGPIITQKKVMIGRDQTYLELDAMLAHEAAILLNTSLPDYLKGDLVPTAQNDADASICHQIDRNDGKIDWHKPAQEIYNQYRAYTPWPGVWTGWQGKRLKLLAISLSSKNIPPASAQLYENELYIGCGSASIMVHTLQLEGKKEMDASTFVNGYKDILHATLA